MERRGHRDGYVMGDVDGVVLGDERRRYGDGKEGDDGEKWVWEGCPEELETCVDLDDVWRRWRVALPVSFVFFPPTSYDSARIDDVLIRTLMSVPPKMQGDISVISSTTLASRNCGSRTKRGEWCFYMCRLRVTRLLSRGVARC